MIFVYETTINPSKNRVSVLFIQFAGCRTLMLTYTKCVGPSSFFLNHLLYLSKLITESVAQMNTKGFLKVFKY